MQNLRIPSAQDVVRIIRPSVEETAEALKRYYEKWPSWSYGPARAMAKPVFSGELSLDAALEGCKNRGNPLGRESNAEVAEHIWEAAKGRSFQCHKLAKRPFTIRRDLALLVDPLFFFVESRRVKIFWLQPRRRYSPTIAGMGALAVMVRMTYSGEFDDFDLELLDLSVPDGKKERVRRIFGFGDLPTIAEDVVRDALERFAQAYDIVCSVGVQRPERRRRRRDDDQQSLGFSD